MKPVMKCSIHLWSQKRGPIAGPAKAAYVISESLEQLMCYSNYQSINLDTAPITTWTLKHSGYLQNIYQTGFKSILWEDGSFYFLSICLCLHFWPFLFWKLHNCFDFLKIKIYKWFLFICLPSKVAQEFGRHFLASQTP